MLIVKSRLNSLIKSAYDNNQISIFNSSATFLPLHLPVCVSCSEHEICRNECKFCLINIIFATCLLLCVAAYLKIFLFKSLIQIFVNNIDLIVNSIWFNHIFSDTIINTLNFIDMWGDVNFLDNLFINIVLTVVIYKLFLMFISAHISNKSGF